MKQLKDYLHLYLGCEMMTYFCGSRSIKRLSAIIGNTAIYNCDDVEDAISASSWDMSNNSEPDLPILRPLSYMTEEEARQYLDFHLVSDCKDITDVYRIAACSN